MPRLIVDTIDEEEFIINRLKNNLCARNAQEHSFINIPVSPQIEIFFLDMPTSPFLALRQHRVCVQLGYLLLLQNKNATRYNSVQVEKKKTGLLFPQTPKSKMLVHS